MPKKKWESLEDRDYDLAKREELFEAGLKSNGFDVLGYRWYYEKTEYLIEKDGVTLTAAHYRGKADKKTIDAQITWVIDCFDMKKRLEVQA